MMMMMMMMLIKDKLILFLLCMFLNVGTPEGCSRSHVTGTTSWSPPHPMMCWSKEEERNDCVPTSSSFYTEWETNCTGEDPIGIGLTAGYEGYPGDKNVTTHCTIIIRFNVSDRDDDKIECASCTYDYWNDMIARADCTNIERGRILVNETYGESFSPLEYQKSLESSKVSRAGIRVGLMIMMTGLASTFILLL